MTRECFVKLIEGEIFLEAENDRGNRCDDSDERDKLLK